VTAIAGAASLPFWDNEGDSGPALGERGGDRNGEQVRVTNKFVLQTSSYYKQVRITNIGV